MTTFEPADIPIPTTDDGEYYALPHSHIFQPIKDHFNSMTEEEREAFFAEQEAQRIKRDEEWKVKAADREAAYLQKEVDEGMAFPQYVWEVMINDYDWTSTLSIHKTRASAQAVIDAQIAHYEMCKDEEDWTKDCPDFHCSDIVYKMRVVRHEVIE